MQLEYHLISLILYNSNFNLLKKKKFSKSLILDKIKKWESLVIYLLP